MHVRQTEFIIEFEFGKKYLSIPNFLLRECHICLKNDGNYYLTLSESDLSSSWWFGIFNDCKISSTLGTAPL
jgi:hypothetical protein